jgi:hypothetical protein
MVRQKVDPGMGRVIPLLVGELSCAAKDLLGNHDNRKTGEASQLLARLIARETSRVFQSKDLCRNERWL